MPPEVDAIPRPAADCYGALAREWLEHHGYLSVIPHIHSSDCSLSSDPFLYYLKRRLGLVPMLRAISAAKSRGSWTHKRLELYRQEAVPARVAYDTTIMARQTEIRALAGACNVGPEKTLQFCETEREDALCALGWFEALSSLRFPWLTSGFLGWLRNPEHRHVATELTLHLNDPLYPKTPLTVILDLLYLLPASNTLWIVDYKTTDAFPEVYANSAPMHYQTLHYLYVVSQLLSTGFLQSSLHLPADTCLGGMVHMILQKPTIVFGQKDRPYFWSAEGKRSGVSGTVHSKGSAGFLIACTSGYQQLLGSEEEAVKTLHDQCGKKPEKVYSGEPDPLRFSSRCLDWYLGRGDYLDDLPERESHPPLNISSTSAAHILDERNLACYHEHTRRIYNLATLPANPINFPFTADGMSEYGKISDYAPFYRAPVADWPEIIALRHFVQSHRDAPTTLHSGAAA